MFSWISSVPGVSVKAHVVNGKICIVTTRGNYSSTLTFPFEMSEDFAKWLHAEYQAKMETQT